ncbi:MAG: hypothetical protein KAZ87_05655 [Spirochaetes bacterium]|nr:hypothetical protein [Spirochaetota bacterium]
MSADKLLYSGPKWQADLFIEILEQNRIQYYSSEIDSSLFSLSGEIYVSESDFNKAEALIKNSELKTDDNSSETDNPNISNEIKTDVTGELKPFRISIPLLIILWILTLGLFQFFWFYKHWTYLKKRDKNNFYPPLIIALFFSGAFNFLLFHRYYKLLDPDNSNYYYLSVLFPLLDIILFFPLKYQVFPYPSFIYLLGFINFIHLQIIINKSRS